MPERYDGESQYRYNPLEVNPVVSRPLGSSAARVYFVDGGRGAAGATGSQDNPMLGVNEAITASTASQGDIIIVSPGTYTITTKLSPKKDTTIMAGYQSNPRHPSVVFSSSLADTMEIELDNSSVVGIEFLAASNDCTNLINIADTVAVSGFSVKNCVFNGADKTSVVGINASDGTYGVERMHISGSLFRDLTGTHLAIGVLGMAYSWIHNNQFAIDIAAGTAISLDDTGAFAVGKGFVIENNDFTGIDATADEVGITIAGTENTTGAGIIRNNWFSYIAAAAITVDKISLGTVWNYYGDAATGGVLVDPGT